MSATHPSTSRTNVELSKIIESCIVIDAMAGAPAAWAIMARHEVPTETILRVLGNPQARRRSDVQFLNRVKSPSDG